MFCTCRPLCLFRFLRNPKRFIPQAQVVACRAVIIRRTTIVARKENNRIFIQPKSFEGIHDFADMEIEFVDVVAQLTDRTGIPKILVRRNVRVSRRQRQVEEERAVAVFLHEANCLGGQCGVYLIVITDLRKLIHGRFLG